MNIKLKTICFVFLTIIISCKNNDRLSKEEIKSIVTKIKTQEENGNSDLQIERINLDRSDVILDLKIKEIKGITVKDTFQSKEDRYSDYELSDGIKLIIKFDIKNTTQKRISFNQIDYTYNGQLYIVEGERGDSNYISYGINNNLITNYKMEADETVSNEMFNLIMMPDADTLSFGGFIYKSDDGQRYNLFFKIAKDLSKPSTDKECYYKITEKVFKKID